jgi:diguanylate cyclase (GGDEF)-like protein/PAS domain S-box-containing protein
MTDLSSNNQYLEKADQDKLAQLAAIVESSQDAIMSKTLDGEITSWNQAAEKLFGYKAHEIIGKNITELIPPERQFEEDLISDSIYKGKQVETYETQRKHQDGFLLDVALTTSPIKDENGTVIGASKIVRDISGRKRVEFERTQAENELRQSKEQLEDFFDNVSDLIQSVSLRDGRFLFVNRSWRKVLGYSAEEISSLNVFDLIAQECMPTCQDSYQQLRNGEVSDIEKAELVLLAKDGRKVFLEGSINVRKEDGIPVATRAIFRDVTDQRQAESILNEQTATLQSFYNSASMMMGIVELSENDIFHISDNLATLKFFHTETEEITGKWSSEIGVPSEHIKLWMKHYHISQELNTPVQFEYAHTVGSKIYWLLATVSFIGMASSNRPRFSYVVQDISDRMLAEEALRQSEDRFQQLASHVPSIIYTIVHPTDAPAYFEYISSAVEDIFEVTPEQVYADSSLLFQKCHPDDIDGYEQMVQQCIATSEPLAFDWRIITPSGKLKWLDVHASFEQRNSGDTFGHGIVRDISDRKPTELALQRSEEKYRLLIDNLHAGFAVYAPDTSIILCNSNAHKLLGLTLDQMLGKTEIEPDWHFFREDLTIMPLEEYPVNQVLSNGLPLRNYVLGINHCDRSQFWVLVNAFPEFDAKQQIQQVAITFIDISDRKQAEAELQKLSERLDLSLKSGAIGSWDWDLSNKEKGLIWDKRMYEIYGLEHLDRHATYLDWLNLVYPDDLLFSETALQEAIQSKKDLDIEFRILQSNGAYRWIRFLASIQCNAQGDPIRMTGINYDVTDRKQIELDLKFTNQHLNDLIIDLNQRHVEMLTLSEISDFLQACLTVEEACNALSHLVEPLFPQCAGGIFNTSASRNRVEVMSSWGESLYSEKAFLPKDCWALRRGRIHFHSRNGLCCNHVSLKEDIATTLCIPMIAQGETIGLFYLSTNKASALSEAKQQVARSLAEQVGMAIANLRLRESLQQQSIRDPLTGLYNRRYLEESLEQELSRAKRQKHPISMIMLDIDHFKRFNDNYGHDAGDYVLQTVGTLLKKYVRGSDIACRYGGEEMILVLPELSLEAASKRAEEIREAISQIVLSHNGKSLGNVTASFGTASFPQHGVMGSAVMQSADAALYRAKAAGRNQVMIAP